MKAEHIVSSWEKHNLFSLSNSTRCDDVRAGVKPPRQLSKTHFIRLCQTSDPCGDETTTLQEGFAPRTTAPARKHTRH